MTTFFRSELHTNLSDYLFSKSSLSAIHMNQSQDNCLFISKVTNIWKLTYISISDKNLPNHEYSNLETFHSIVSILTTIYVDHMFIFFDLYQAHLTRSLPPSFFCRTPKCRINLLFLAQTAGPFSCGASNLLRQVSRVLTLIFA